jgi:hypothetical protein
VEPRQHPALSAVLRNICTELGDLPITLVHGQDNGAYVRDAIPEACSRVATYELNARNLSSASYSALLTSPLLWETMSAKHVLVFQTDAGICEGRDPQPLLDALASDYCGAPWEWDEGESGNGGFSLRNRSQMLRLCPERPEAHDPEDVYFATACSKDTDCTLCPPAMAAAFANESTSDDHSWAFHNNWAYRGGVTLPNCDFNEAIRDAQGAPPAGPAPDLDVWVPALGPRDGALS